METWIPVCNQTPGLSSVWDQAKMSMFNWLWYETTTYLPYAEETSYENSLLVQQTGALALSSLTHVLRSLTPNARWRHFQKSFMKHVQLEIINLFVGTFQKLLHIYIWNPKVIFVLYDIMLCPCDLQGNLQITGRVSAGEQGQSCVHR